MTIASTTNKITYSGDGESTEFAIPFRFLDQDDLVVTLTDADGTATVQTLTTEYTVSGAGEASGGTVTMVSAPGAAESLTIKNDPPQTQETDYQENDAFPAESHETALDKLTLICQSLGEQIARSVLLPVSSEISGLTLPEPAAGKTLGWNEDEDSLENLTPNADAYITLPMSVAQGGTGATTVGTALTAFGFSDFIKTLIGDTTASDACGTLGAGSLGLDIFGAEDTDEVRTLIGETILALPAPASDNTYEGVTVELTAEAATSWTFGETGYMHTDGTVKKGDCTSNVSMPAMCMCVEAALASGATGTFLLFGMARDNAWSWTLGTNYPLWASSNGGMTQTAPPTSGHMAQVLGWPITSNAVYFKPSADYLEVS